MNWSELLNIIIKYLLILHNKIFFLQYIALVFIIFIFLSIIIVFIKSKPFWVEGWHMQFKGLDVAQIGLNKIKRKFRLIKARLETKQESNYKIAVIQADKLLDNLFERAGFPGDTMGDKLKQITQSQISNLDDIWKAHKLRNSIVHDIDSEIKFSDAKHAIEAYEKALEELEAL